MFPRGNRHSSLCHLCVEAIMKGLADPGNTDFDKHMAEHQATLDKLNKQYSDLLKELDAEKQRVRNQVHVDKKWDNVIKVWLFKDRSWDAALGSLITSPYTLRSLGSLITSPYISFPTNPKIGHKGRRSGKHHSFPVDFAVNRPVTRSQTRDQIVTSLSFEAMFYFGLATFLTVTDRIQRPYLQFSSKRWGLITGLRGYLTSAFFVMGFKVIAPLFAVFVTWPVLGLPALVSVLPFLVGCLAQHLFETYLDKHGSSCWPLVPVIFEVYRLYQLTKAAYFIEKLMFTLRGAPESALLLERSNALVSMIVTFQVLGLVCLWSLLTFLLRLFPSRPVAENY